MVSGAFLQSKEWGEFQKSVGRDVVRVNNVGQFIVHRLPFGMKYAFYPRGPITDVTVETLKSAADRLGVIFLRLEPTQRLNDSATQRLIKTIDISPPNTLITDLTQTDDALLAAMHEKTRYNVGLATRKGVTVTIGADNLDAVWPLFEQTASRGQFHLHPKSYYEKMLASQVAFLAVAKFEGEIVAANIMIDYAGMRTYLHGASSDKHRNVMGPYLLHWELMRDAKATGLTAYDWWGVAPADSLPPLTPPRAGGEPAGHPWSGITRFKLGFGGQRVDYPGTFDFVVKPSFYRLYQILRRLRRVLT
jgi:lipid II:glycine glycyltransferase (peptidoglycan interpeptide bridge formation enzyme)